MAPIAIPPCPAWPDVGRRLEIRSAHFDVRRNQPAFQRFDAGVALEFHPGGKAVPMKHRRLDAARSEGMGGASPSPAPSPGSASRVARWRSMRSSESSSEHGRFLAVARQQVEGGLRIENGAGHGS